MDTFFNIKPIGHVQCARTEPIDDAWDSLPATVVLDISQFDDTALLGLDSFSHVEVLYQFHKVTGEDMNLGARHPRGNPAWPKIGIFAQRGKDRPNRLGATICTIVRIEGCNLFVHGLDAIDGSPVLDLKPVMSAFLPRGKFREPEWAGELMSAYW